MLSSFPLHGCLFCRKEKRNTRLTKKTQKRRYGGESRDAGRGVGEARMAKVWQGGNSIILRVSTSGEGRKEI